LLLGTFGVPRLGGRLRAALPIPMRLHSFLAVLSLTVIAPAVHADWWQECAAERESFCKGAPVGGGRIADCIDLHASELSARCRASRPGGAHGATSNIPPAPRAVAAAPVAPADPGSARPTRPTSRTKSTAAAADTELDDGRERAVPARRPRAARVDPAAG